MKEVFLKSVEAHQAIIYKISRLYRGTVEDREDLFQEIVFQLWKAYPSFKGESKFSTWMYRIALNTALASFRKKTVDLEYKESLLIQKEVEAEQSENEQRMFAAFKMLNKTEKAIIALYLEDYSHKEIAEMIGITENHIGVKMSRIKTKLKTILNQ